MLKLSQLEPSFYKYGEDGYSTGVSFEEADGLDYLCPKCFVVNGNSNVNTHHMNTEFEGRKGKHSVKWHIDSGNSLDNLTLSPSIRVISGCMWHGYIRNGEIVDA